MGIFSGEDIYTVGTVATKLVDAKPNVAKQSVIRSITSGGNIAEGLIANITGGFKAGGDRFFRYGRDFFTNGLPEGFLETSGATPAVMNTFLTELIGEPTVLVDIDFSLPLAQYWSIPVLISDYGLDDETDIIANPPFTPGPDPVVYIGSRITDDNEIEISCTIDLDGTVETFLIAVEGLIRTAKYYHMTYYLDSDVNQDLVNIVINPLDYPDNPEIQVGDGNLGTSPFYPVVPVKTNKKDTIDTEGELKDTSSKMLKMLGLDLADITEGINDTENNPGAKDVDDAFITFAINLHTEDRSSLKYLYEFFYDMQQIAVSTKEEFEEWEFGANTNYTTIPATSIDINDGEYNTTISFNHATERVLSGVVAKRGRVVSESIVREPKTIYIGRKSIKYEYSDIIFRKQITDTEYSEITINGLMHSTYIYKGKYVRKTIATSLELDENGNQEDNGFYIPLHRGAFSRLNGIAKVDVYYEGLTLLIYAINKQHLKWYQTGVFRAIVIIIAIVWTIYSFGTDGGSALGAALGIGTGTAAAFVALVVQTIAIGIAVGAVLKGLVSLLGIENAFILAAIAIITAIVTQNFEIALSYLPSAESLLTLGTSLFQGIGEVVQDDLAALGAKMDDFIKEAKEWQQEIDDANDLLSGEKYDPLMYVRAPLQYIVDETPGTFYNRTIHTGNPGVASLDAINMFFDNVLMLPKPKLQ